MSQNNEKPLIKELAALTEIAKAISSSFNLETVTQNILSILHDQLGMERGTITLLDPETNELSIEVARGLRFEEIKRGRYKIGEGITGKVVAAGEPIVVPNVGKEPLFLNRTKARDDVTKANVAFVCVPIRLEDKTIGALSVDRLFQEDISFDEDVRFLTIISSMIAQAVRVHELVEKEKESLTSENLRLKHELKKKFHPVNIIGESKRMTDVYSSIDLVSTTKATVMLRGESGTGKELAARAIHYHSDRADKPFIKVSCAALPETLLESELFGYEKGAFTGATAQRKGKFEVAGGGTLFLDEIGELPLALQPKLLRVLDGHGFLRLGGQTTITANVRIVAATNRKIDEEVPAGRFREDLYYRLNVGRLDIPPLRDRPADILPLAARILENLARKYRRPNLRLADADRANLQSYGWPGNVRELQNVIERAVLLSSSDRIDMPALAPSVSRPSAELPGTGGALMDILESYERRLIQKALADHQHSKTAAARVLGLSKQLLNYKLKKYGMS